MKQTKLTSWIMTLALLAGNAFGYEVWIGTHLMRSSDATNLSSWALTAAQADGFNVNRAPHDTDPASNNEYRMIFLQFTNAQSAITEFARSQATRDPAKTDELAFPSIAQRLEEIFTFESSFGYQLTEIMFYDERGTFNGVEYLYEWTDIEIQYLRDWLDANGQSDVGLKWNVRNNSLRNQQIASKSIVDSVEIEASTSALLNNANNQITFFTWFWNNPAMANKPIALQIPRTLDSLNQIRGTRRVAQMLGGIIGYGDDGMRSNRLIFLPVTYNDDYEFAPEFINNGTSYTNTLSSIALSLIEQRELFEGRLPLLPSVADADDLTRTVPPTISKMIDRVVNKNTATPAIPVTVGDTDTPLASLTLIASSSNTLVVPSSGIVLGGSGANRTVTITPAPGQSGTTTITVKVFDGKWSASSTFTLTVGGVLPSLAADSSVKDDSTVTDTSATTTLLGAGGGSPFVDRGTVYVFQLPNLGAVATPFTGASFAFNYVSKEGTLKNNDLYGLGRRSSPTVLGSDFYGQSTTADPTDATRLQSNILNNLTPLGTVGTSAAGDTALRNYLNAQYASGAGIGQYVFLRLNTTGAKSGVNRAKLTMSEGAVSNLTTDTRPQITYTNQSDPALGGLSAISIRQDTSMVMPFTIDNMSLASLVVTAMSSNTALVPNPGLVLGGTGANRTLTINPVAGMSGQTDITVQAGNGAQSASATFKLTVLRSLFASSSDADVLPTGTTPPYSVANQAANTLLVGTSGGNVGRDRCVVFPFQLPDLGTVANPFYVAWFAVNHESNLNSPAGNVAVYGLGSRAAGTVLADDYWSATPAIDSTDATLLQANLIASGSSSFGVKMNDDIGSANLIAYLNAQYAGGAGIGKFVFLRLSADAAQVGGSSRYVFTSTDGAMAASNNSIRPQLNFLTNNQVQSPVISLVVLGAPVDLTSAASWSDAQPAHTNASYVIPNTGNLRSETGTSTFPGLSLAVQAGGRFQVRSLEASAQVTTVTQLLMNGGSSFAAGDFAELAAGTGTNATNVIAGAITNAGYSRFLTFGNAIARNLKVLSVIAGYGRIQALEGSAQRLSSVIIDNPNNSFYGTWESGEGSSLIFNNAGAVGTANIEVQAGGVLEIKDNWSASASLAVADAPSTNIKLASYDWQVSALLLGGASIADGIYTAAELNALTSNPVFTGAGTITVGAGLVGGPVAHWKLNEGSGTTAIDSSGAGKSGALLHGATWGSDATRASFVSFDGTDDRIATPFTYALGDSDSFTWAWWAKRTGTGANGALMVGNRYPHGAPGELFEFIKFTPSEAQFANTDTTGTIEKYNYADLPLNTWRHYAMVKSGNSYQWYVDGVEQGSPVTFSYNETVFIPFSIGGDDDNATPGGRESEHFLGYIDDVVLYDRALTAPEIQGVRNGFYVARPNTAQEDWRLLHFGTSANTGNAADTFDANNDGEINLLEFATGQSPHAQTLVETSLTLNGANLEFRYPRNNSALADGIQFTVEWTDTLSSASWNSVGVTDSQDPVNPGDSIVENRIAILPPGTAGRRFVRLKMTY